MAKGQAASPYRWSLTCKSTVTTLGSLLGGLGRHKLFVPA